MTHDPVNFQSEKLERTTKAMLDDLQARNMTVYNSNLDLGEIIVFMSKGFEKVQASIDLHSAKMAAGVTLATARQMMMHAVAKTKDALSKEPCPACHNKTRPTPCPVCNPKKG